MSAAEEGKTYYRYCGRDFTIEEMALIRYHIAAAPPLRRSIAPNCRVRCAMICDGFARMADAKTCRVA